MASTLSEDNGVKRKATVIEVTPSLAGDAGPNKRNKTSSPYQVRQDLLHDYIRAKNAIPACHENEFMIIEPNVSIGHPLERIPGKLEEFGCEKVDQLTEEQLDRALSTLSMEEVDDHCHSLVVKSSVRTLTLSIIKDLEDIELPPMFFGALTPDVIPKSMYPKIDKWLTKAQIAVAEHTKKKIPKFASDAMEKTVAVVLAIARVHGALLNFGDASKNDMIHCKILILLRALLVLTDEKIGFIDPFSRKSLVNVFHHFSKDWKVSQDLYKPSKAMGHSAASSENENGVGRSIPANQAAQRETASASSTTNGQDTEGSTAAIRTAQSNTTSPTRWNSAPVIDFVNALGKDSLARRTKTHLQLEIINMKTKAACNVVVSGGMDLKNLGQLLAFLTGQTQEYNWHSQKGKSLKDSSFSLFLATKGQSLCLADKAQVKSKSRDIGLECIWDKSVKLAQIFQGLTTGPETGIVYDSEEAKGASLVWSVNERKNLGAYIICCAGIVANKCVGRKPPLPRVVNGHVGMSENIKMSLNGKFLYKTNDVLRGDRNAPSDTYMCGKPPKSFLRQEANKHAVGPIVNRDDGSAVEPGREVGFIERGMFSKELVASAEK